MSDLSSLPDNMARLRKARNLSQEQLAEAAQVGVDTVGRIERGERRTVRPQTLERLATALGVGTGVLLGAGEPATIVDAGQLRAAIGSVGEFLGDSDLADGDDVPPLGQTQQAGRQAWEYYVAGRTTELLTVLPALMTDSRRLVDSSAGEAKAEAQRVLALSYRLGAGLSGRLGLHDLAWTSAERAVTAAHESSAADIDTAVSIRYLVWVLVRQGRVGEAARVAVRAAEAVEPGMLAVDRVKTGVFGNLMFNAASAALLAGRGDQARDYLDVARAAAVRHGQDHASEAAIFGPRAVGLQTVDLAVRLGEPDRALRLAERLPGAGGKLPRFWEAGHRLHLAKAAADLRRTHDVLDHLDQARVIAPSWSAEQPLGKSIMGALVDRAARRPGEAFARLATHYGVLTG
jgi:transcriptional regulator with XRE-family HTH domain